ncbi:MAG TPA: hypothetical protein VGP07_15075 [Polyangia bacterium]
MKAVRSGLAALVIAATLITAGCNDGGAPPPDGGAGTGGAGGQAGAAGQAGAGGAPVTVAPVTVSTKTRTTRTTTWSVNYWDWMPDFGNSVAGTETLVAALTPAYLRVGGYNNDANTPDPFDHAQLDAMVSYARAIGAEPILQVPHLADTDGSPPTPATGAAMVQYANVTKGYGIKYFSIGNEPDLYDSMGLPSNMSTPAIPGYTPAEYCASVTAYVAAMKAVDPTIKIVGPDLAYKYQANAGLTLDWLTPILQTCGDAFDVISIHRYPFEAAMASLPAAAQDPVSFRQVMTSVVGILQTTGQGEKPLALTEMNVAYDATTGCVLGASPGTVGSALWMADILGSSIQLGLWTSAVWDISDPDDWSLGLIGLPAAHLPRPEYYAYALYSGHFGPTLLPSVGVLPAGVAAYASRDLADDATEIIVINWNTSPVALSFQVTDLATAPAAPTYLLPATSMAAIEVQDAGKSTAWVYGEDERRLALPPQVIAQGTAPAPAPDGGTPASPAGRAVGQNCPGSDAGFVCPSYAPENPPVITTGGANHTTAPLVSFGSGTNAWGSYTYAGPGQTAPSAASTTDGDGLQITGGFVPPVTPSNDYEGVGLYYSSGDCLDLSSNIGLAFELSGTLGGCQLAVGIGFSGDSSKNDPGNARGGCDGTDSTCYPPSYDVTGQILAAPSSSPTVKVPFTALGGGQPIGALDPRSVVGVQWQLTSPSGASDGGGCSANFTVTNVRVY